MRTVVEIEGLTKDYRAPGIWQPSRRALDHLTLSVVEGEVFGLIGPNGAGKTTTLKLLFGHLFPTAGQARIFGRPTGDASVRAEVGYLPESPYFYDHLTGRELLDYFARLFGLPRATRRARAREVLERVGLESAADVPLRKYSKGMLQRVGIAQTLLNRPRMVFLDEPMSGLDPLGRRDMAGLIRELHAAGVTVFFSSHILSDVEALCDRIGILSRGRLAWEGRLADVPDRTGGAAEVVAEGAPGAVDAPLARLARRVHRAGSGVRIEVDDAAAAEQALDLLRKHGARVVSLTPARPALEEFFVHQVEAGLAGPTGEAGSAR